MRVLCRWNGMPCTSSNVGGGCAGCSCGERVGPLHPLASHAQSAPWRQEAAMAVAGTYLQPCITCATCEAALATI